MWLWIIGVVLVIIAGIGIYLYRAVQRRIKPEPLFGIPSPPPSHNLMGHVYEMLHPFRHGMRLEICDRAQGGVHQLTMMKHVSVFINDCQEVARVLLNFKEKGPMVAAFRLDQKVPDLYTSDGKDWQVRHKALTPSLVASYKNIGDITTDLLEYLHQRSESGEVVDLMRMCTLFAFDVVCRAVFHYEINALAGSEEGSRLADALDSLATAQAGVGYFPQIGIRKVPPEELQAAKDTWRAFLAKLMAVMRTDAEQYESKHAGLQSSTVFSHALLKLQQDMKAAANKDDDGVVDFTEEHIKAEVHQVLRHGYECVAGQLAWAFVALHRNLKKRRKLEAILDGPTAAVSSKTPASSSSTTTTTTPSVSVSADEYVEAFLKEVLRRYPTVGNATVRTVLQVDPETERAKLMGQYSVPIGTLLHLHIWSLHNTSYAWIRPKTFIPERWLESGNAEGEAGSANEAAGSGGGTEGTTCPTYLWNSDEAGESGEGEWSQYDGVGFLENSLCYLPFSAGPRACPGKLLSLCVLRAAVRDVAARYRLDPQTQFWDDDPGNSATSTVVPADKRSVTVVVTRRVPGQIDTKPDEGWADESDDEGEKETGDAGEDVTTTDIGDEKESD